MERRADREGFGAVDCCFGASAGLCWGDLTSIGLTEASVLAALLAGRSKLLIPGNKSHLQIIKLCDTFSPSIWPAPMTSFQSTG